MSVSINTEVAGGASTGGSGGGHVIEDEGTPVTQRSNLNFAGAGVSVADSGGKTVVTIPGGGGLTDGDMGDIIVSGSGSTLTLDIAGAAAASSVPLTTKLLANTGAANEGITLAQIQAAFGSANVVYTNTSISLTRAAHAGKIIAVDTSGGARTLTIDQNSNSGFQLYDALPMIVKVGSVPANQVTVALSGVAAWRNDTGMLKSTTANCPVLGFFQGEEDKWTPTVPEVSVTSTPGVTIYTANNLTHAPASSTADLPVTGSDITIPYSALGPNGWIECFSVLRRTSGTGTIAPKGKITTGAGIVLAAGTGGGGSSGLVNGPYSFFFNRGAANVNTASSSTGATNTTIDTSAGLTIQMCATVSDTTTAYAVDKWVVRVNYGA